MWMSSVHGCWGIDGRRFRSVRYFRAGDLLLRAGDKLTDTAAHGWAEVSAADDATGKLQAV